MCATIILSKLTYSLPKEMNRCKLAVHPSLLPTPEAPGCRGNMLLSGQDGRLSVLVLFWGLVFAISLGQSGPPSALHWIS